MLRDQEKRSEHNRTCQWCGTALPENSRPTRKTCGAQCRRALWELHAHVGTVRSVRRLASGKMSVIIWMEADVGMVPGSAVHISEVNENEN